jgi:NodT family efflux transporter outer membrane factor (OMF) lipoprotein
LDLAQQENVVAEERALLPPLLQAQRQVLDALAVLVGKLPEGYQGPGGSLDRLTVPEIHPGLPSQLLARRPDVQSAEAKLRAANQNTKAAVAALFPTINLTAQGGGISNALSDLFKPASIFYIAAGSLSQPIFRGGALDGGIELTKGQYAEQVATYQKAVFSAFADVEDALAAVEMGAALEQAEQVAVDTARNAFEITQARLFSGTIDILTVLNTQRSLFQSQNALAQARLAHAQAVVSLAKALGGGWQRPEES